MIRKHFQAGEEDKGSKKLTALMAEVMYDESASDENNDRHPHVKHYLPYISEISAVISQLSTKVKSSMKSATN